MYNHLVMRSRLAARRLLVAIVGAAMVIGLLELPPVAGQSTVRDWTKAANGKMAFEVASVKQNDSDEVPVSDVLMGVGDVLTSNVGLFSAANFQLMFYISFAYKLSPGDTLALNAELPKWAQQDRFDIQGRVPTGTTKDQMRLMMQSLLAERFKLAVHIETKERPIYGLVLVKPDKLGPQLKRHSPDAPPCASFKDDPDSTAPTLPDGLPESCGGFVMELGPHEHAGARNVSVALLASWLTSPAAGPMDRPVVDETGLSGTFDLTLDYAQPRGPNAPPDPSEPTITEALREQLGLKLEAKTGPLDIFVIDHIEEPSPN